MKVLICALGFCLIFEGVFPFLAPAEWKRALLKISDFPDSKIRIAALCGVLFGLGLVWLTEFL